MAAATGNVTNQAVQFQNNGAPSRQYFHGSNSCNGPTMTLSPFMMGNETRPVDPEGYVKNANWGAQVNFMIPLDSGMIELCKQIARRHEQKMRLDYELIRATKCAEIMQKGFTFRPGTRVAHMCSDLVPIVSLTNEKKATENMFNDLHNLVTKEFLARIKSGEASRKTSKQPVIGLKLMIFQVSPLKAIHSTN